jgi:hypothetical protein
MIEVLIEFSPSLGNAAIALMRIYGLILVLTASWKVRSRQEKVFSQGSL